MGVRVGDRFVHTIPPHPALSRQGRGFRVPLPSRDGKGGGG